MLEEFIEKTTFTDLFIVVISSIALVSFWRGAWGLFDLYLFPGNHTQSFVSSLILGLTILFLIALYRKDRMKRAGAMLTGEPESH